MKLRSECGVTEEQLVDVLLADAGGGETEAQAALLRHAKTCASCAQQLREWEALLGDVAPVPGENAAPSIAPSAALQQRLFAAVRRRAPLRRAAQAVLRGQGPQPPAGEARRERSAPAASARRGKAALVPPQASGLRPERPAAAARAAHDQPHQPHQPHRPHRPHQPLRREPELPRHDQLGLESGAPQAAAFGAAPQPPRRPTSRRKRSYLFGTAVAAAALLYIGSLCAIRERMGDPAMTRVPTLAQVQADDEILANMGLVVQAKTAQFPVQSRGSEQARGVAWVNDDSEEMLLLVEGLPSLPGQDYRVWSVRRDGRTPLGTLRLAAGKAHLHYHGAELHGADAISVSREPANIVTGGTMGGAEVAAVKLK